MRTSAKCFFLLAILVVMLVPRFVKAQSGAGTIVGAAKDADGDILPGAPVTVTPGDISVKTNAQGEFVITNLAPRKYTLSVSYLGFTMKNLEVTVTAGQTATANFTLDVATQNDTVVVTAGRSYGEAEAVNETRASDTIVNILPAAVIRSLPNANVADSVGRLPGVTLERDEGEGKYVQIRGTEPRLSNLTIDGVVIPSPEGTVRQVKLDTIPAGLIDAVEINKTLLPNMDGDAIGGSVNLITKIAGERPTLSIYGSGGFTPIIKTVGVYEFGGTIGQRLGQDKRWGAIFSGSYDYNGRGIDDFEAGQNAFFGTLTPYYDSGVFRSYKYDRTRYGFGGSLDYKINDTSLIYLRGIFSDFADEGRRWEYVISTNPDLTNGNNINLPSITTERRIGDFLVSNLVLGGNHVFTKSWFNWGVAVGRSRMQNPINGGEAITDFVPIASFTNSNCQYDPAATKNKYKPQFTQACFDEAYNPANFQLNVVSQSGHGQAAQLNLTAFASYARNYQLASHPSTFEFGFKIRNAHKFDDSYTNDYQHNANIDGVTPPVLESTLLGGFNNPNYYGGAWKFAPNSPSWELGNAYLAAHPGDFTLTSTKGGNGGNFDLVERVTAGYFMDTIDFGRFRVLGGLRIEGTDDRTLSYDGSPGGTGLLTIKGGGTYVSLLPSASVRFRLDKSSDLRFVYGRALNRPDPQFLTQSFTIDCGTAPCTVTMGNNTLRPEHANNYDLLYERYLTPFGLLQAGFFYKSLSDPVVITQNTGTPSTCPPQTPSYPNCLIDLPVNAGTAYISGFEVAFLYHFTRLPSLLSGLGVSANYSYAASQAHNVNPGNRTDSPALLRQAPNTWNISPTYDHGRLSVRLGLAYNGPNIFVYNFVDGNSCGLTTAPAGATFDPVAGSRKGPCGDQYLYAHFQVDLQGSYHIRRGLDFTASALNLNNEVFGFYYGSPQFVNQREYYKPTYSFGFRWDPFAGRR